MILQELNVKCNRIGPPGFAKLCGSLKDNTTLKRLFVSLYKFFFLSFYLIFNKKKQQFRLVRII